MPLSHAQIWNAIDVLARREGLSASGLARRAGLDATSFNPSKRFSGDPTRPRWPSTESLMRVLQATGLSLGEFAGMADDPGPAALPIPMLGLARAGNEGFFDDAGLPLADGWEQTELPTRKDSLFSLRIEGNSMTPLYRPGDRVIVDLDATEVRRGDRVALRTRTGETLAKEIATMNVREVVLASMNPDYPPRHLARDQILWIARILWVSQ
ncbi:helix-turn-helix transcriptional regulator [Brevundimonas sp. 2P05AA]|uniref:S24 family peptidase n=1 Tax=Brevundimonas sp. 2P05AA TaxID=3132269 RepID=UPI00399F5E8D